MNLLIAMLTLAAPSLDVKVDGPGLMRFAKDGRAVYAKSARLVVREGTLVHTDGPGLLPGIKILGSITGLEVDPDGTVHGFAGSDKVKLGRLVLAIVPAEGALARSGPFLLTQDRPRLGLPGEGGFGTTVRQARTNPPVTTHTASTSAVAPRPQVSATASPAPTVGTRPRIVVREQAEVAGPKVLLGEVADLAQAGDRAAELAAVVLADTPTVGGSRTITPQQVASRIRMAGLRPEDFEVVMPASTRVERRARRIAHMEFVKVAATAAAREIGSDAPLKSGPTQQDFLVEDGEVELRAERVTRTTSAVSVTVAIFVNGNRVNSRVVTLSPEAEGEGVRGNTPVKILIRAGGAVVEVAGRARTSGWLGESVTVVTETGSTHIATVVGPGRVEVRL
jgi:flagella basal body P-ring formation protein FlgA